MKCIIQIKCTCFFPSWCGYQKIWSSHCICIGQRCSELKVMGTWREAPGRERPAPKPQGHVRALLGRGKKHKPLQSYKFIGLEINTNISLRNSSGKTCTQRFSVWIQPLLPWPLTLLHKTSQVVSGRWTKSFIIPQATHKVWQPPSTNSRVPETTRSQRPIRNVPFTLIKLPIRSMLAKMKVKRQ